jgi:hypothetical protein
MRGMSPKERKSRNKKKRRREKRRGEGIPTPSNIDCPIGTVSCGRWPPGGVMKTLVLDDDGALLI